MSARLPGTMNAAPAPCRARQKINCSAEPDKAQPIEVSEKTAIPAAKVWRSPYRSPAAPPTMIRAESSRV